MHIVIVSVALLFQSSALYYLFEYVSHLPIDKSRAVDLWVGCAKTVCPSSSGNNGAFVNELRRWTNGLATANSKMGGLTFLSMKKWFTYSKKYILLNFETKVRRTLSLYAFKLILTLSNLRSLTKVPLFPLKDGQSWHSPLKDGHPYFCQWKSRSYTQKSSSNVHKKISI